MDSIVRTLEEIELTNEELEVINGATQVTLQGNVFGQPVNVTFNATSLSLDFSSSSLTGILGVNSSGTISSQ
jgi:hypothetical protein